MSPKSPENISNPEGWGLTLVAYKKDKVYSNFERFSNVADEVPATLLPSFLKYEVLVVVIDWYDFEFSIKTADRKYQTEDSAHVKEIEIIDNRNFHSHFKVYLGIRTIKTAWLNQGEIHFLKIERNISIHFDLLLNHLFAQSWRCSR